MPEINKLNLVHEFWKHSDKGGWNEFARIDRGL